LNVAVDDDGKSFWVLKVKLRNKIVADGINDQSFDMANKGKYVNAEKFNQLTADPDTVVVDMRNHYEFEVGHFENAIEIRKQIRKNVEDFRHLHQRLKYLTNSFFYSKLYTSIVIRSINNKLIRKSEVCILVLINIVIYVY
jgi:predicted sulfurtransferase